MCLFESESLSLCLSVCIYFVSLLCVYLSSVSLVSFSECYCVSESVFFCSSESMLLLYQPVFFWLSVCVCIGLLLSLCDALCVCLSLFLHVLGGTAGERPIVSGKYLHYDRLIKREIKEMATTASRR